MLRKTGLLLGIFKWKGEDYNAQALHRSNGNPIKTPPEPKGGKVKRGVWDSLNGTADTALPEDHRR